MPGENVSFKTRKEEHESIMTWINTQDNLTDSLRFLIEREISENGIRNLQEYVPATRNFNPGSPNRIIAQPSTQFTAPVYHASEAPNKPRIEEDSKRVPESKPVVSKKHTKKQQASTKKPVNSEISEDDIESWA